MRIIIEESGMRFGEYEDDQIFEIEKSAQYTKNLRQNGIKCCEFILQRGKKLYFIEAKSSCPRQIAGSIPTGEKERKLLAYQKFVQEIVSKMRHTLLLYGNILLKRYSQEGIPANLANADLSDTIIHLILVINPQNGIWKPEPELQDDLRQHLEEEIKIWKIKSLLVINAQTAREKHFII